MTGFPKRFGPYELVGEIARGANGAVYRARPVHGGSDVALKALREEAPDAAACARFRREAQTAARLRHPNLVAVLDAGEVDGRFFYTMPLIEGRPLAHDLDGPRAAALIEKVARAIHHAHQRGVIHRDLKPTNILVRADGEPVVTDFGIARDQRRATQLTTAGELLGTPAYMAPEQISGMAHTADARTDVHALGAVLYFLLTGTPPFDAITFVELSAQILHSAPMPPRALDPGIDPCLEEIVMKCLRKEPSERFSSAGDLADSLATVAGSKRPSRSRWILAAASGAVLMALAMTAVGAKLASNLIEGRGSGMIRVGSAWIDRSEVTCAEYGRFVSATGRKPPPTWRNGKPPKGRERRPVTFVSREDAAAYAAWAGLRLPTLEELRDAAAGIERLNADKMVCAPAALESGPDDADSAEDVAESGVLHLGGNVSEWTSSESIAGPRLGVVFGGNWRLAWSQCLQMPAIPVPVETRDSTIGFRCARD